MIALYGVYGVALLLIGLAVGRRWQERTDEEQRERALEIVNHEPE